MNTSFNPSLGLLSSTDTILSSNHYNALSWNKDNSSTQEKDNTLKTKQSTQPSTSIKNAGTALKPESSKIKTKVSQTQFFFQSLAAYLL
jgi:hypothetical protein